MQNLSLSQKVNKSSLKNASPRLMSYSIKIAEIKDMISKSNESSKAFEAQNSFNKIESTIEVSFDPPVVVAEKENIKIALRNIINIKKEQSVTLVKYSNYLEDELHKKIEISNLENNSSSLESNQISLTDASAIVFDISIAPTEGEEMRMDPCETHRKSREHNDIILTGSTSAVPFDPPVVVSRKEGIEIVSRNFNNVENIFLWSSSSKSLLYFTRITLCSFSLSVESNQTSLTNAGPMLFDVSIAPTEGEDKRVEPGKIHRISKEQNNIILTGSTSVVPFHLPVVLSRKEGTEISDK